MCQLFVAIARWPSIWDVQLLRWLHGACVISKRVGAFVAVESKLLYCSVLHRVCLVVFQRVQRVPAHVAAVPFHHHCYQFAGLLPFSYGNLLGNTLSFTLPLLHRPPPRVCDKDNRLADVFSLPNVLQRQRKCVRMITTR